MQSAPINISRVRELFSRPDKIKASEFIYREIATRMVERLLLVRLNPNSVLDAGCGRGADLQALQTIYPHAQITGIDASQELLQQVLREQKKTGGSTKKLRQKLSSWLFSTSKNNADTNLGVNSAVINGNFCQLPLVDKGTDLVWSNLALHWHPQPDQVFKEWRRVLNVDGLLMFSCFGPDSLKEIRQAFSGVDKTPHTLPFVDMHDFGDMLVHAGFATPVMDMEIITLTYASITQLLAEIRSLGGNPLQTRNRGLMGKVAWKAMCNKLEQLRQEDGRIPLTLEVIYGHAFTPITRPNKPGVSIIKFDRLK